MLALALTVLIDGCSKEGPAGTNGKDANVQCGACHNSSTFLYSKILQYDNSDHATNENFTRNTTQCAPCHTSEGFRETVTTGLDSTMATINNPSPQNCRTCHFVHTNYDTTDFNLTYTNQVKLRFGGPNNVQSVDMGEGNLCGKCHQARAVSPAPPAIGGPDFTISSTRWGPHHGLQTQIFGQVGLYELPGSTTYEHSPHKTRVAKGCPQCHMATAYGNLAGGHTWKMSYEYEGTSGDNVAACTASTCHDAGGITSFSKINSNIMGTIDGEINSLRQALASSTVGILDTTASAGNPRSDILKKGTFKANVALAAFNYLCIVADGSHGAHDAKYVNAILKNSLQAITQ